ncbi:MAG: tetratricopeptide repeat protein [Terracidiphilus sp.]
MLHVPASTSHNANTSLTEQTDADAQFRVGMRYYKGEDVPKDYAKAAYWFCKSADQGHPDGQWHLSMLYFNGQGLPKDYKLAAEWCRKATENGSPAAQFYTAYKLLCGLQDNLKCGGRQDYTMAAQWCRKAAEQGHVEAPYNLGSLYYHGQGVPQDYKEAYFWQVIGDTGDDSVQRPPTRKKSIGENLSPKERTEVLERATRWLAEHPRK